MWRPIMDSAILKLRITGAAGVYRVLAEVAGKQGSDNLAALPPTLRESLAPLQEAMLRTTDSLRDRGQMRGRPPNAPPAIPAAPAVRGVNFVSGSDDKDIRHIGTQLFDCVFQRNVWTLYKDALEAAHAKKAELQIKLCVEAPELSYIPWETMFDETRLFHLSCSPVTPFARVASMEELDLHIYDRLPLRILCMVSAPNVFIGTPYELRTDVEQAALDHALEPLKRANQVELCWTASGTLRELKTRILRGDQGEQWDVFMFIGHGLEGRVVLEEDGGPGYELIPAEPLRGFLEGANGPKLVILNSCKGAKRREDRLASTAEVLVRSPKIAAVVAMQFDISDIMGAKFSPTFFSNLMLGVPIQQAMTLTRLELQAAGFTEWISPVLYMQSKDGRVLKDAGPAAARGT